MRSCGIFKPFMLHVYTALTGYHGSNRLNIEKDGVLKPSDNLLEEYQCGQIDYDEFVDKYVNELRLSYKKNNQFWRMLLDSPEVTLTCSSKNWRTSIRRILANILVQCGALYNCEVSKKC